MLALRTVVPASSKPSANFLSRDPQPPPGQHEREPHEIAAPAVPSRISSRKRPLERNGRRHAQRCRQEGAPEQALEDRAPKVRLQQMYPKTMPNTTWSRITYS